MRFAFGRRSFLAAVLLLASTHSFAEGVSIDDEAGSNFKAAKRVVISQFGVEFYTQYGNVGRSGGNTVSQLLTLQGVSDATMQALTDKLYAETQVKLKEAGFEVMDYAQLAADAKYQDLVKSYGKASPYVVHDSLPAGGLEHLSKLFAPTGRQAFYSTGAPQRGNMSDKLDAQNQGIGAKEAEIAKRLDVTFLKFNFLANYVIAKATKNGFLGNFAQTAARASAETATIIMANDTQVQFVNADGPRIFGNVKRPGQSGAFYLKEPLQGDDVFKLTETTPPETKSNDAIGNAISSLFGAKQATKTTTYDVKASDDKAFADAYAKVLSTANEALIKSLK